jgi:DNA polymerase-3 subunit delta'
MADTTDMLTLLVEQEDARKLLGAAVRDGPAHAYLFHGPRGVGKRTAALAFAGSLLGGSERVERRSHPDLYVVESVGEQIRIDAVREMRRDLHMRPFESSRRVYLVFGADLMNEDAADALLKDLEEPPDYAVVVLVADELGPLPETIRSRCQLVPFRRLSRRALEQVIASRRPELPPEQVVSAARIAAGRIDRAERLLDPARAGRRRELIAVARNTYLEERFDPGAATRAVLAVARAAGEAARASVDTSSLDMTPREIEQHVRRIARGAERDEIVETLDLLATWYRDLLAAGLGAAGAVLSLDFAAELESDAGRVSPQAAGHAAEIVAETRRRFYLNINAPLALEAMFLQIADAFTTGHLAEQVKVMP